MRQSQHCQALRRFVVQLRRVADVADAPDMEGVRPLVDVQIARVVTVVGAVADAVGGRPALHGVATPDVAVPILAVCRHHHGEAVRSVGRVGAELTGEGHVVAAVPLVGDTVGGRVVDIFGCDVLDPRR